MTALLTIENLTKAYGSRTILDSIDLRVDPGESVAIVGQSGSGKSSLLNIVGLLDSPTTGTVRLQGSALPKINSRAATALRRDRINYLFQSFALISSSSALDNILIGLHSVKLRRTVKEKRILELLSRLGLSKVAHNNVMTLSGGERQRVALARCLLKPGELILADEPTGALDDALADIAITEMLALQKDYGKTLLIVTHDHRVADRCDRTFDLGTPRKSEERIAESQRRG
ncbi:ABC transporter ATP-binding protein [Microbacterium dextranolyticum]|uniref:ABC transporter ATP-binding protein n=1 Tax=Microbacterium dextranolyticum TaxID=36806 RepID=A0A9W6HMZ4_9MICO|nr:ABC transporter ATP-binding protein [Microbacterium dextranolyticum]MBM7462738.1 putative ABC transport system ATP-binding protein [Microbacterium dextranolyticum]GLJ96157.1 ABC transporter ATP-binding protein [Microbacterium dextranolyticum]